MLFFHCRKAPVKKQAPSKTSKAVVSDSSDDDKEEETTSDNAATSAPVSPVKSSKEEMDISSPVKIASPVTETADQPEEDKVCSNSSQAVRGLCAHIMYFSLPGGHIQCPNRKHM